MSLQQAILQRAPLAILLLLAAPLILMYTPSWVAGGMLLFCIGVAWQEWEKMLAIKRVIFYRLILLVGVAFSLFIERSYLDYIILTSMLCCVITAGAILKSKDSPPWIAKLYGLSGLFGLWAAVILLLDTPITLLFGLAWVASIDAAGLIVGKLSGKTLLAPHISPQKTVEGAMAGLAASVLMIILWGLLYPDFTWKHGAMVALLVWLGAVVGDLVESRVKRIANIKDSGQCLPGHGGMADRLDSMMMGLPVIAWILL